MPREPKASEVAEQEVGLSESLQTPEKPVVDAKVVYLGSNPKMSLSLKGRLVVETAGNGKQIRTPTRAGREHYDFASTGSDGELIEGRTMPPNHPLIEVRGRPFCGCAHPDHLFEFSQQRDPATKQPLFRIVASAQNMSLIQEYVQAKLRVKKSADRTMELVTAGAA